VELVTDYVDSGVIVPSAQGVTSTLLLDRRTTLCHAMNDVSNTLIRAHSVDYIGSRYLVTLGIAKPTE